MSDMIERPDGSRFWYRNGLLHRDDGPAIEYANGDRYWYRNGKLHREDGPAMEHADGSSEWFRNGERHRDDGPAVEHANGDRYWYWEDLVDYRGYQFGFHRRAGGSAQYVIGRQGWPSLPAALKHYGAEYQGDGDRKECIRLLCEVAARITKQGEIKQ